MCFPFRVHAKTLGRGVPAGSVAGLCFGFDGELALRCRAMDAHGGLCVRWRFLWSRSPGSHVRPEGQP